MFRRTRAVAAAALTILACRGAPVDGAIVPIDAILDAPADWESRVVTVSGEVERAWGDAALTLGSGTSELLVVVPRGTRVDGIVGRWEVDDVVQVVGRVRDWDRRELEADGDLDDPRVDIDYAPGGPIVVADRVVVTPHDPEDERIAPITRAPPPDEAPWREVEDEQARREARPPRRAEPVEAPTPRPARAAGRAPVARPPAEGPSERAPVVDGDDRERVTVDRAEPYPTAPDATEPIVPPRTRARPDGGDLRAEEAGMRERAAPKSLGAPPWPARVVDVIEEDLFVVELPDGRRSLVRVVQPELRLQPGQVLTLSGDVRELPDEEVLREVWGLDDEEIARLTGHLTFLRVTAIGGAPPVPEEPPPSPPLPTDESD